MLHRLKDDDRVTFLSYPRPNNPPVELADSLDQSLKHWNWIEDTYSVAVGFMHSQFSNDESTEWRKVRRALWSHFGGRQ